MKKITLIALFATLIPFAVLSYQNPGNPSGFVNDFAGMLSSDQHQTIESKLDQFEKDSSSEIVVVTIETLNGDTIENFAVHLFEDWGVGKKDKDNGVLLLIAKQDRKIRIEVGYGLEGALTDAQSFSIIDDVIKPPFQDGDYYEGINQGVDAIILATKGEYEGTGSSSESQGIKFFDWAPFIGIFVLWLVTILARSKSWWAGGIVGGIIGLILWSWIWFLLFGGIGLLLDYLVSKFYHRSISAGRRIPWWTGGNWGGRSGGGGFGGFGGGSSGGGGASGGW